MDVPVRVPTNTSWPSEDGLNVNEKRHAHRTVEGQNIASKSGTPKVTTRDIRDMLTYNVHPRTPKINVVGINPRACFTCAHFVLSNRPLRALNIELGGGGVQNKSVWSMLFGWVSFFDLLAN